MSKKITHEHLVKKAGNWLKYKCGCRVILLEHVAYTFYGEIPDAIGWRQGGSILVECKTSLADFKADAKKRHRRRGPHGKNCGMGNWRFYIAPPGLIKADMLPEGWGLYELHGRSVRHAAGTCFANARVPPFETHWTSERAMLVSALAKQQQSASNHG